MKKIDNTYSKENIRNRMLKNILVLWDVHSIENMDPIVKLLIESLSSEIFKLFGDFSDMEERVLSRLAMSMTPSSELTAKPSHALIRVMPNDADYIISNESRFKYDDNKFVKRLGLNKVYYTPIESARIVDAKVSHVAAVGKLFSMTNGIKHDIGYAANLDEGLNYCAWIGVDVAEEIESIDNLSLFFDLTHVSAKADYLRLIPYAKWSVNDEPIEVEAGLYAPVTVEDELICNPTVSSRLLKDIYTGYAKHYVTVTSKLNCKSSKKLFPDELKSYYDEETVAKLTKPLLWFKVVFPPHFHGSILEYLLVDTNVIPVTNISICRKHISMKENSTFVPIDMGLLEHFIEVHSVSDSSGKKYVEYNSKIYSDRYPGQIGTYSLRKGGCERFVTSDAKNYLTRLVDLLRDESLSFTSLDGDAIKSNIDDLVICLDRVESSVQMDDQVIESPSYLLVDKTSVGETIFVDYKVTNGVAMNGIKKGAELSLVDNSDLTLGNGYLYTPTKGGAAPPDISRINDIYRYWLVSHDSITSRYDVESFCSAYFADTILKVKVKAGCAIGPRPNEGVINTVDVHVTLKNNLSDSAEEELKEKLFDMLQSRSPLHYNYQIFIHSN